MRLLKKWFKELEQRKISKLREIARYIGEYYLEKNRTNIQNYNPSLDWYDVLRISKKEIFSIGITRIEIKSYVITITCQRPGILIGLKGNNIHALQAYLQKKNKKYKISIKEEQVLEYLISYAPDELDDIMDIEEKEMI